MQRTSSHINLSRQFSSWDFLLSNKKNRRRLYFAVLHTTSLKGSIYFFLASMQLTSSQPSQHNPTRIFLKAQAYLATQDFTAEKATSLQLPGLPRFRHKCRRTLLLLPLRICVNLLFTSCLQVRLLNVTLQTVNRQSSLVTNSTLIRSSNTDVPILPELGGLRVGVNIATIRTLVELRVMASVCMTTTIPGLIIQDSFYSPRI